MLVRIICPGCKGGLQADDARLGRGGRCPAVAATFTAEVALVPPLAAPDPARLPPPPPPRPPRVRARSVGPRRPAGPPVRFWARVTEDSLGELADQVQGEVTA